MTTIVDDRKGAMQYAITVASKCVEGYGIRPDTYPTEYWLDALHAGFINGDPSYDTAFRLVCLIQAAKD